MTYDDSGTIENWYFLYSRDVFFPKAFSNGSPHDSPTPYGMYDVHPISPSTASELIRRPICVGSLLVSGHLSSSASTFIARVSHEISE